MDLETRLAAIRAAFDASIKELVEEVRATVVEPFCRQEGLRFYATPGEDFGFLDDTHDDEPNVYYCALDFDDERHDAAKVVFDLLDHELLPGVQLGTYVAPVAGKAAP